MSEATHSISLTAHVNTPEDLENTRSRFALQLKALPDRVSYSYLSVSKLDEKLKPETSDPSAVRTIRNLLLGWTQYEKAVDEIMAEIEDAGVVFKERDR